MALISVAVCVASAMLIGEPAARRIGLITVISNAGFAAVCGAVSGLLLPEAGLPLRVFAGLTFAPVGVMVYGFGCAVLFGFCCVIPVSLAEAVF